MGIESYIRKVPPHIAFACLGCYTWTLVTSIFSALAPIADHQPEGYDIGTFLNFIQCLSNSNYYDIFKLYMIILVN